MLERDIAEEAMLESGLKHQHKLSDEDGQMSTMPRGMVPHN